MFRNTARLCRELFIFAMHVFVADVLIINKTIHALYLCSALKKNVKPKNKKRKTLYFIHKYRGTRL